MKKNENYKNKYKFDSKGKELGEVFDTESLVDEVGYVPANIKIERMLSAGKLLSEARRDQFDFPAGNIDLEAELEDISRIKGVSVFDVETARQEVVKRIRAKQKERVKQIREKEKEERKKILRREIEKEIEENPPSTEGDSQPEESTD